MKVNGYIGCAASFMSFDLDVFFFERLEISGSCKPRKTCFDCVFVERLAFTHGDAAAKVSVREALIPAEIRFAALCRAAWARIKLHGRDVRGGIERWTGSQAIICTPFLSFCISIEPNFPIAPQRFDCMFRKRAPRSNIRGDWIAFSLPCSTAAEEGRLSPLGRTCRRNPPRPADQRLGRAELGGNASALWTGESIYDRNLWGANASLRESMILANK